MQRIDLYRDDYNKLIDIIEYVIRRYEEKDPEMASYLKGELNGIQKRLLNEQTGSEVAQEIDIIINFFGGGGDEKL